MSDNFFKIRNGISLGNLAADPSNPVNGDFYYNTTLSVFRGYQNGAWISFNSGNANEILESLKNQLVDGPYQLVTPNVFSTDAATKIDGSSTGAYNAATKTFNYTAIGQTFVSIQMGDATEFLTQALDTPEVDLSVFWTSGFVDTAATYEISRDGGYSYQPMSMSRVGQGTLSFYGNMKFSTFEIISQYATSNVADELNATSSQIIAQQFLTTSDLTTIRKAVLNLTKVGSPTGNIQVAIYNDSAGSPNTQLAISASYPASSIVSGDSSFIIPDVTLTAGTYYVAILSDATYKASFVTGTTVIKWNFDNAQAGGGLREYTGAVWNTVSTSRAKYVVYGENYNSAYNNSTVTSTLSLNTTTQQSQSQGVVSSFAAVLTKVRLYTDKVGSPSGNFKVKLVRDSAGVPSALSSDILVESALIPMSTVPSGANTIDVTMPRTALAAMTSHIVIETDATYKASYSVGVTDLRLRYNSATGTLYSIFNGTTWSNSASKTMGFFAYGSAIDLRVRITSSVSSAKLDGHGFFYNIQNNVAGGVNKTRRFDFAAVADNTSSFDIGFVPDPLLLRCEYVQSGQVFTYPAFTIAGSTVTFPTSTFNNGGVEAPVTLWFKQVEGSSFDNADSNAALLAANHLGAPTGTDYSLVGRGIYLRRPDGTLRELALDNSDNIVILSTP